VTTTATKFKVIAALANTFTAGTAAVFITVAKFSGNTLVVMLSVWVAVLMLKTCFYDGGD
jgi:hypothetical protein